MTQKAAIEHDKFLHLWLWASWFRGPLELFPFRARLHGARGAP